jgi:hypothetical protein
MTVLVLRPREVPRFIAGVPTVSFGVAFIENWRAHARLPDAPAQVFDRCNPLREYFESHR